MHVLHRRFTLLSFALLSVSLSACVSLAELGRGLDELTGQDIKVAFERLGYPDGKQVYDEDTVYTWERQDSYPNSGPMFGVGIGNGYGGFGVGTGGSTIERCRIKLIARANKIHSHEYDGNYSACKPYLNRLKKIQSAN